MSIPSHYNPKCSAKHFTVYHAGKMDYRVIDKRTGEEVSKKSNLSEAFSVAKRIAGY